MGLGGLAAAGAGFALGGPAGAAVGYSMGDSLFGSGQRTAVPGAVARPTEPDILGKDDFVKAKFRLGGFTPESQNKSMGLLGNLEGMATQAGPTQGAQRLLDVNKLETQGLRDQSLRDTSSARATAEANLAMKGGLGTGSRERLASQTGMNTIMNNQQLNNQAAMNSGNIQAKDEETKLGLLRDLPGQYMQHAQTDIGKRQFDIGNSINTANTRYGAGMQEWGANQLAIQQAQSANKASKGLLGIF